MKKIILFILCGIELLSLLCIYLIGGMAGVYAWNINIFIVAPIALIAGIVQIVIIIIRLFQKKKVKINIIFAIVSIVLAYPVTILLGVSNITYPTKADASDEIVMSMPVKNPILMGGKEYKVHAVWPSECYAFDILSEPYDTGSDDLESYGIYDADVIAPISGEIIGLENSEEDILPNKEEFKSLLGNYVFIKIDGTGTYLIMAHLKKDSIAVSIGDHVSEGEYIGKVGNSGTTSEPHLHIQHQRNNPNTMLYPTLSEGLPIVFK